MIGGSAGNDICMITPSNDTFTRKVKDIWRNIEENTEETLENSNFPLQIGETTCTYDVTHENDHHQFLCDRQLFNCTTGKYIFDVLNSHFEIKISWNWLQLW